MTEAPPFHELFGGAPDVGASAHGRVNLIGEHTDTSGGYVLPVPIPQSTRVELARRAGLTVRAFSASRPGAALSFELGAERRGRGWLDYVQGVTNALARAGLHLGGFDLRIASSVPAGAGVSSSAALEVAVARALREAFSLPVDDVALAVLAQRAESDFVGAPVGVMDQMSASLGEPGHALFLDTRSLAFRRVPLPSSCELVVVDSGVRHAIAGGEYRARRGEVQRAAAALGVPELRSSGVDDLPRIATLLAPLDRRARHVVTENARVLSAVDALERGDLPTLGRLLDASHASLRDDFEVSVPEVDALVETARAMPGVLGARLTGGGFGGSIVALARAGSARDAGTEIVRRHAARFGPGAALLVPA